MIAVIMLQVTCQVHVQLEKNESLYMNDKMSLLTVPVDQVI